MTEARITYLSTSEEGPVGKLHPDLDNRILSNLPAEAEHAKSAVEVSGDMGDASPSVVRARLSVLGRRGEAERVEGRPVRWWRP